MIDKTISHYRILKELGRGGMGEVYLAEDLKLDRKAAIKFLPEHLTRDKENVERFEREAKAAAQLNHPNIVTIYDIIESEDQFCIVMEYVEGESLRKKIDDQTLSVSRIRDLIKQLCDGLDTAHRANIVHRDIKPENILVDTEGRAKILDFGLAKLKGVSKLTKETSTLGTIQYISPEQLEGKEVDHRSDIWSLGILLYEMLTGEVPFKGSYEQAITYAILNEEPKLLNDIKAKYTFDMAKLLAKDPDKRLQTCRDVSTELNSINLTGTERKKFNKTHIVLSIITITIILLASVFFIFYPEGEDKSIKSLAVLPLENLSNDPDQEYFVDGITDVLISDLAQISALKVISRTSAMQYKGVHKSVTQIADELNVDAVVEGTVFSDGQKVRITTQLVRATDDRHLWAEKYEYDLKDIFSLQTEVAQAIASAIEVQLSEQEKTRISTVRAVDPATYQLYLKGRFHWNQRTPQGIWKAAEYFQQAIDRNPDYAAAYAGLADCYVVQPAYYMTLPDEAYPQARAAALRALEIDDKIAEAYTSMAAVRHNYDWAWSDAEKLYKQAIALNANYATAHQWYSELLVHTGRINESLREINIAYELDPLSTIINMQRASFVYYSRDYDQAIKEFQRALELHPNFSFTHLYLGYTYCMMNKYDEAVRSMQKVKTLSQGPRSDAYLAYAYAVAGKHIQAKHILDSLLILPEQNLNLSAYSVALIYIALGETDQTIHWLEKAYMQHDYELNHVKVDPAFDPVNSDPRFKILLQKMGLEK